MALLIASLQDDDPYVIPAAPRANRAGGVAAGARDGVRAQRRDTGGRMQLTRITAVAGAVILLVVTPGISRAQRAQAIGVTRRAAPTAMPQALRVTSTGLVGRDTTQATASDTPRWVGAAIGVILGGVYGYKWYGGSARETTDVVDGQAQSAGRSSEG